MRPEARAVLAVAALAAFTGPFGAASREKTVLPAPPKKGGVAKADPSARPRCAPGEVDLSAVCPAGFLPDGEGCIPFDRAAQRAVLVGAPPREARGLSQEQIPRKEGRPAAYDAYRLPVSALSSMPSAGARGGLDVDVPAGALIRGLVLAGQEGDTTLFASDAGPDGLTVITLHIVREGAEKREILLYLSPIDTLAPGLSQGSRVGETDLLATARGGALHLETRKLRDGLDLASLTGAALYADDRALRIDPRNVLPPR